MLNAHSGCMFSCMIGDGDFVQLALHAVCLEVIFILNMQAGKLIDFTGEI